MVAMIVGSLLLFYDGGTMLARAQYTAADIADEQIYRIYSALKGCNTFYGIALIAIGMFQFTVRKRLNRFQADGPGP